MYVTMIWLFAVLAMMLGRVESIEDADPLPPVLMHYMPWFQWGGNHWKQKLDWDTMIQDRRIASHYTPIIGPYDSIDRDVVRYHLELMKTAGVAGIIVNWYGTRSDRNDYLRVLSAADVIIEVASDMGMLFTVCYEDYTLVNPDIPWTEEPEGDLLDTARKQLRKDMVYIRDNYASKPGFLREGMQVTVVEAEREHLPSLNNRPVMLVFGPRNMRKRNEWTEAMSEVFTNIHNRPKVLTLHGLPKVGDGTFSWFPKLHNSTNIGTQEEELARLRWYLQRFYNKNDGTLHIGSVSPGFESYYKEGRNQTKYGIFPEYDGHTFDATMDQAQTNRPPFIQAATWNDWEEGTAMEPREDDKGTGGMYYYLLKLQHHILGVQRPDEFSTIFEAYKAKKGINLGWANPNPDLISLRGENKACRGDTSEDSSESYYSFYHVARDNVDECFKLCSDSSSCHGVEYNKSTGRCEVWNRMPLATADVNGYECYITPELTSLGGENKACRGDTSGDSSESYYSIYHVARDNVDECFKLCYDGSICHGVEYKKSTGRCEVWNRMPLATADANGYKCYIKGAGE